MSICELFLASQKLILGISTPKNSEHFIIRIFDVGWAVDGTITDSSPIRHHFSIFMISYYQFNDLITWELFSNR